MKYTLICEDDVGQYWKNSSEFESDFLDDVLENFTMFLRGCGFHFNGNIVLQTEVDQFRESINDMLDESQSEMKSKNSIDFTMNALSAWADDYKRIEESNKPALSTSCSFCGIPNIIAQRHGCNQPGCPVKHAN